MIFETLLIESPSAGVGLIRLNRPRQYNALNTKLLQELAVALEHHEQDDAVSVIVITGSEKAFAAGADITEMLGKTGDEMKAIFENVGGWSAISKCNKPTIAAVSGFAFGGGFELALQCDIILASTTAVFALPEVTLGLIPAAGGTQRLTRIIGKSLAMEMILNAKKMNAEEALERGVVSQVLQPDLLLSSAFGLAKEIADRAPLAVRAGKACINKSFSSTLEEGLDYEQHTFVPLFNSETAKRLMGNFTTKKK